MKINLRSSAFICGFDFKSPNNSFSISSTRPTPSEPRISFATQFTAYPLLHQHTAGRLIYRYPPAQYKTIDGAPGIEDGAGLSKQVYDKYNEIKLGGA